jgi:hypothetical protein
MLTMGFRQLKTIGFLYSAFVRPGTTDYVSPTATPWEIGKLFYLVVLKKQLK